MVLKSFLINKIFIISLLFFCAVSTGKSIEGNPDEISEYYQNKIKIGELKPLFLLEITDKEKYEIIIHYIRDRESINNYYYSITILGYIDEYTMYFFTQEEYNSIRNLPEYADISWIELSYNIRDYESLLNKNQGFFLGNPTNRCFSVIFNINNEFIRWDFWE
ncbi:MAG: hypothetical protein FWD47_14450 [Treponema sp.]|nr:hypothetical protein [Treponema sp.]